MRYGNAMNQITLDTGLQLTFEGDLLMREFRVWMDADTRGDFEVCYDTVAKIVVGWNREEDCKDPISYDALTVREFRQLTKAALKYLTSDTDLKN